jgi:hypothetical protein
VGLMPVGPCIPTSGRLIAFVVGGGKGEGQPRAYVGLGCRVLRTLVRFGRVRLRSGSNQRVNPRIGRSPPSDRGGDMPRARQLSPPGPPSTTPPTEFRGRNSSSKRPAFLPFLTRNKKKEAILRRKKIASAPQRLTEGSFHTTATLRASRSHCPTRFRDGPCRSRSRPHDRNRPCHPRSR